LKYDGKLRNISEELRFKLEENRIYLLELILTYRRKGLRGPGTSMDEPVSLRTLSHLLQLCGNSKFILVET